MCKTSRKGDSVILVKLLGLQGTIGGGGASVKRGEKRINQMSSQTATLAF